MAQSTKSKSKSSASRNGSRANASKSRSSTAAKRSTSRRSGSAGSRAKQTSATRRGSGSNARKSGAESIMNTAVARTKSASHAVADAASKAKTPIIAGGSAIAGVAVGAVVKDRMEGSSKGPIKRLRGASLSKPARNLRKVDLDTVKSVADRMSAYGRQASDIAEAVEKTRKKNN
jgi:hypothetical protein